MQPAFVNERNLTQRAAQPFQRALRTPEAGAHRGNVKVPGTEPSFPHEIGYAVRPSTSSYSFGSGFGRPRPTLHLTSSLDHFAMASTASSLSSTSSSGGQRSSPLSPASRPSMSNYSNTVGMSKWTTTPGNRSFYPFPMGRHTFGVVNR